MLANAHARAAPRGLPADRRHRLRDIRQVPDGLPYVVGDEDDGAILRIEPAL
jgi:glucose/arabinose dehydrogenase